MITVEGLTFSYTNQPFIGPLDFEVREGEIFGFLGPSGAGKSTVQKILTGTLTGYRGSVKVCGTEVKNRKASFYEKIGVDFEFPSLYEKLTARENLEFFASLYGGPVKDAGELLAEIGLESAADKKVGEYSKGMKSRLNFIKALINDPKVLFLDEPGNGLDPANLRGMKDMIRKERDAGKAVILTTHNMHDAAELCDRVAFFLDGKILALDTPSRLTEAEGAAGISFTYVSETGQVEKEERSLSDPSAARLLSRLMVQGRLRTVHSLEPTLEEVFLKITGRRLK